MKKFMFLFLLLCINIQAFSQIQNEYYVYTVGNESVDYPIRFVKHPFSEKSGTDYPFLMDLYEICKETGCYIEVSGKTIPVTDINVQVNLSSIILTFKGEHIIKDIHSDTDYLLDETAKGYVFLRCRNGEKEIWKLKKK